MRSPCSRCRTTRTSPTIPIIRATSVKNLSPRRRRCRRAAYNPFGPPTKITYGSGTTARPLSRTYDLDGIIKTVVDGSSVGDGLNLTYTRDAVGNLTVIKSSPTVGNRMLYDGLNRLTQMDQGDLSTTPLWRYTFDGTGNRLTSRLTTQPLVHYTYPLDSHHLIAVGSTQRSYYAIGNTTQIGSGSGALGFHFDDTHRMDQFLLGGVLTRQYLTNALGQRVMKSTPGDATQTIKTVYDEAGHRLGDFNAASAIVSEYIWMDDLPVGVVDGATATVKYIEPDHLGTPRVVIDPTANHAIWSWPILNDPFGQTQPVNLNGSNFVLNLRFPGQYFDAESGVDYNYHRNYESSVGRYLESDPIGVKGDIATYSYAINNPFGYFDFNGLEPIYIECAGQQGLTVCDGKGGFETRTCTQRCLQDCVRRHEEQHAIDYGSQGRCRGKPRGASPTLEQDYQPPAYLYAKLECRALRVGISCLDKKRKQSCLSPNCSQQVNSEIERATKQMAEYHCDAWGW